ncbi:MAG: nitroreductase family protein [Tannerellaceae bacterium]|jgi:nitroreductase|nr:nitroreductase family protein [Tannerellaceae bacterium]
MDSFSQLVNNRRSSRKFNGKAVALDDLAVIVRAGLVAPSSKGSAPCCFVVVEDKENLRRLSLCKPSGAKFIADCAIAIVVCVDVNLSDVWVEDASIASIMMQLQAEDLGLGSCWCQVRGRYTADGDDSSLYVADIVCAPGCMEVLSIIGIGHKMRENMPYDSNRPIWHRVYTESFLNDEANN